MQYIYIYNIVKHNSQNNIILNDEIKKKKREIELLKD